MADKKDRFSLAESASAAAALAGYFLSPLDNVVRGVCETIPSSITIADDFIDAVGGPANDSKIQLIESTKQNDNLSIKEKNEQLEAYTLSKSTKLKQTLDDAQIKLNPYGTSSIVDKPADLRSQIMEKSKDYIGRILGDKKMQENSKFQADSEYRNNYNKKEEIESAAVRDINKSNEQLKTESNLGNREKIVERKKEVNELLTQSQNLSIEQIYEGKDNDQYVLILDKADDLNLAIPNYEIYGATGVCIGAILAAYAGVRIGKTINKTINTTSYIAEKGLQALLIPYRISTRISKALKKSKNLENIADPRIELNAVIKPVDNNLYFQFINGEEIN